MVPRKAMLFLRVVGISGSALLLVAFLVVLLGPVSFWMLPASGLTPKERA
jgi:hypothetical protein